MTALVALLFRLPPLCQTRHRCLDHSTALASPVILIFVAPFICLTRILLKRYIRRAVDARASLEPQSGFDECRAALLSPSREDVLGDCEVRRSCAGDIVVVAVCGRRCSRGGREVWSSILCVSIDGTRPDLVLRVVVRSCRVVIQRSTSLNSVCRCCCCIKSVTVKDESPSRRRHPILFLF